MSQKPGYHKLTIPIEEVRPGDIDPESGLEVVTVLCRDSAKYVRCTLKGGWPVIDGYWGDRVTVRRRKGGLE